MLHHGIVNLDEGICVSAHETKMKPACKPAWVLILVFGALMATTACDISTERERTARTLPVSIDLRNTERTNIELDMGAGELTLNGGATNLVDGSIEYNVPAWKPEISTSTVGLSKAVTIKQPEHHGVIGHVHYVWNLQVNNGVLVDMAINCGAGHAQLNLGDLRLRSVDVNIGAGQVEMDLRGHPRRDYDVSISGGIGQATVYLPQGVGIWAEAHGGIGHIDVEGLRKTGDHWENDLYDNGKVNVRLKVEGGIGEIHIIGS